ncbi:Lactonase, 7-bladed beta-propeller-domain-containing protein [Hypoxylon trugodes]|uniref:Lactonase, 7-bladed beta-propeller-domain-containing protein n=1 Tax=Hypoxylon trugodes TaxID=326681 RepID=UPI00219AD129|nr:Lactonase, 7-bladed beta-propeller-domain-containing protein [Hypoxylon trugodes]KAI1394466.1 Lactonase, 7-bladed beta-propeller-domain-containing protein [Hypoxylon trugodes]
MRVLEALIFAVGLIVLAEATKHQLIIGTFSTNFLYTIAYDDQDQSLQLIHKTPTNAASSWISLSHDKKNLYGTDWNSESPSFVSYSVKDAQTIQYQNRLAGDANCANSKSIFVTSSPQAPYVVYGNYFYSNAQCGTVMSVDASGSLQSVIQNYNYSDGSAVHGVSFSNDFKFLYSADDGGNSIWVHDINSDGTLDFKQRFEMPVNHSDPRHIVAHPAGEYAYAVWEGTSGVGMYYASPDTSDLYLMRPSFSLITDDDIASDFWADEVALSANNKYLWASNRARDVQRKGYISAIAVDGEGHLNRQLFLVQTTNSGGFANAVSPSPFDDRIVALTDNSTGFVEVWKMDDNEAGAKAIAHLDIGDGGGCCANAVWYS